MAVNQRTLYYYPGCCHSLKSLLALKEKNITFQECLVNIDAGENYEDIFFQMNRACTVPVLRDEGLIITESEEIIDQADRISVYGPDLVPYEDEGMRQEVGAFRVYLQSVRIDAVTYGTLAHNLSVSGVRLPLFRSMNKRSIGKRLRNAKAKLQTHQQTSPSEIIRRIQYIDDLAQVVEDRVRVKAVLQELQAVFDTLEGRLDRLPEGADWLFGTQFTAVDVSAAALLYQLYALGLDPLYFSSGIRPIVHRYYQRLKSRPAVVSMIKRSEQTITTDERNILRYFIPAGVVVTIALAILRYAH